MVHGETLSDLPWKSLETKYTIIHYQSPEDLKKFDKKVKFDPRRWSLKRLLSTSESDDLINEINKKVDALYERVQEILDMHKKMNRVIIKIFYNREQLHDAYVSIYKTSCRFRAWYIYDQNTIYINVDDLHEGILAHELAHSIIDHYLSIRPPKTTAEILARYVDSHLYE